MEPTTPEVPLVPPGRIPVRNEDVVPFAKKSCSFCHGTGIHTKVLLGKSKQHQTMEQLCPIALKRYMKAVPSAKFEMDHRLYRDA